MHMYKDAAIKILKENRRPLTCKEITEIAIKEGLLDYHGNTPVKSMYSILYKDAKKGKNSMFILKEGHFSLKNN